MLFWVIAALLTLGASLAVMLPLSGRRPAAAADGAHDLEVYSDQLSELDRDAARGLIQPAEAEQARAEIARRILTADKATRMAAGARAPEGKAMRTVGMAAVLAVPLVSWGIYAATGSPDLPSQPLSARLEKDPAESSVDELLARAEGHLVANPEDGRGWSVLAPIYARLGRYPEAVTAYRNAIRLNGATAALEAGLGESIAGAAGGTITADAQAALSRALELQPDEPKARFLLASALVQEGKIGEAMAGWQDMLAGLPADSPWRAVVEQALAEGNRRLAETTPPSGPSNGPANGPTQEQIDAASTMSAEDRGAMIEGMVASLDEKLRQNPRDLEGWTRLVRSYQVLGQPDAARDALKRGTAALGPGTPEAMQLAELASTLGLTAGAE
jgi:cytochrome c-type biogenesis protein CcmH